MVDITEQVKQAYKSAIIGYLRERCKTDTYLAEACKKENKSLDGCIKYITEQARKKAENNIAVIPDAEVFEWAVHYFLEDSLNCESGKKSEEIPAAKSVESPEKEKPVSVKKSKKTIAEEAQLGFDF